MRMVVIGRVVGVAACVVTGLAWSQAEATTATPRPAAANLQALEVARHANLEPGERRSRRRFERSGAGARPRGRGPLCALAEPRGGCAGDGTCRARRDQGGARARRLGVAARAERCARRGARSRGGRSSRRDRARAFARAGGGLSAAGGVACARGARGGARARRLGVAARAGFCARRGARSRGGARSSGRGRARAFTRAGGGLSAADELAGARGASGGARARRLTSPPEPAAAPALAPGALARRPTPRGSPSPMFLNGRRRSFSCPARRRPAGRSGRITSLSRSRRARRQRR